MQFVNPYILFGLAAISIPIIVHLFNFRRYRKVYFTNVKFIEELKLETQKRSKLKHLIVLLLRILAISFLVFAFAQPYIPLSENKIEQGISNAISIYIDNSFSMESSSENGLLIDEAKKLTEDDKKEENSFDSKVRGKWIGTLNEKKDGQFIQKGQLDQYNHQ